MSKQTLFEKMSAEFLKERERKRPTMNFPNDFEIMSLTELEAACESLRREKRNLEIIKAAQENELRRVQNSRQNTRDKVQHLIEQIVLTLLPDLSEPTLAHLERIFPTEPNLFRAPENQLSTQLSFAQKIVRFWRKFIANAEISSAATALEQRRVLLRGVLWQLSDVPPQSRSYRDLFQPLMERKQELSLQEKAVNSSETQANQAVERFNVVSANLSACEKAIARRRNIRPREEDFSPSQSSFDSGSAAPIIFGESTNFDSSQNATSATSASDDFSFGGGGDFGGGGAGGSWENFS